MRCAGVARRSAWRRCVSGLDRESRRLSSRYERRDRPIEDAVNPTIRALIIVGAMALIVAAVLNYGGLHTEPKPLLKFEPPKARTSRAEPGHADQRRVDRGLNFSARGLNGHKIDFS